MESMKASTVLLYESRNTFLGACHVLSREECVTKPSIASLQVAINSHGQLSKLLILKVISVVSVKHSRIKFTRSINAHNNETCSRNKSFSLDVIIFQNSSCDVTLENCFFQGLFTWSGGPRSSGVGFFCFHALGDTKQKKPTPLNRGPPLHVNRVLVFPLTTCICLQH